MALALIQKKISPGQHAKFVLKTGKEVQGIVQEITNEYVSVYNNEEVIVILEEFIGSFQYGNNNFAEDDEEDVFAGLSEDTVVEKVEFDWEESKSQKDITESTIPSVSSQMKTPTMDDKQKLFYIGVGCFCSLILMFIAKLIKII